MQAIALQPAEEAAARAGVTGRPVGAATQHQRILIAIDQDLFHRENVTGRFALLPQPPARTGMEMRKPRAPRRVQRFADKFGGAAQARLDAAKAAKSAKAGKAAEEQAARKAAAEAKAAAKAKRAAEYEKRAAKAAAEAPAATAPVEEAPAEETATE